MTINDPKEKRSVGWAKPFTNSTPERHYSLAVEPLTERAVYGYLGLHVLKRQVIFIDIAVAQVAALGAVAAHVFFHVHGDSPQALACSGRRWQQRCSLPLLGDA